MQRESLHETRPPRSAGAQLSLTVDEPTALGKGAAIQALRRWWWLVVSITLASEIFALKVLDHSTYSAVALVQAETTRIESRAIDQAAKGAVVRIRSQGTFALAAEETGIAKEIIEERTRVSVIPETDVVRISVTDDDEASAVTTANSVAKASIAIDERRVAQRLDDVTADAARLLRQNRLRSDDAERAREDALGSALGAQQSEQIISEGRIRLLSLAAVGDTERLTSRLAALVVSLGGLLLGCALALALGARRGRLRSRRHAKDLYPLATVVNASDFGYVTAGLATTTTHLEVIPVAWSKRSSPEAIHGLLGLDSVDNPDLPVRVVDEQLAPRLFASASDDSPGLRVVLVHAQVTPIPRIDRIAALAPEGTFVAVHVG